MPLRRLYVMLHRMLYPNFGRVAGITEFLAVIAAVGLAFRVREEGSIFIPALIGAILMVAAHAFFWLRVQRANIIPLLAGSGVAAKLTRNSVSHSRVTV